MACRHECGAYSCFVLADRKFSYPQVAQTLGVSVNAAQKDMAKIPENLLCDAYEGERPRLTWRIPVSRALYVALPPLDSYENDVVKVMGRARRFSRLSIPMLRRLPGQRIQDRPALTSPEARDPAKRAKNLSVRRSQTRREEDRRPFHGQ